MKVLLIGTQHFFSPILMAQLICHKHHLFCFKNEIPQILSQHPQIHLIQKHELNDISIDLIYDLTMWSYWSKSKLWNQQTLKKQRLIQADDWIQYTLRHQIKAYLYCTPLEMMGHHSIHWIDESCPLDPWGLAQIEEPLLHQYLAAQHQWGFPLVTAYCGWVYGYSEWFQKFLQQIKQGVLPDVANLNSYWSLIHQEDLAKCLLVLGEYQPIYQKFILCDEHPVMIQQLIQFIGGCFRKQIPNSNPKTLWKKYIQPWVWESMRCSIRAKNEKIIQSVGVQLEFNNYQDGVAHWIAKKMQPQMVND